MTVTEERYADVPPPRWPNSSAPRIPVPWSNGSRPGGNAVHQPGLPRSVLGEDKNVRSIVAVGKDITRLKNDQKANPETGRELMLVLESGSPNVLFHAPDHTVAYVSPRIRALLGCHLGGGEAPLDGFSN